MDGACEREDRPSAQGQRRDDRPPTGNWFRTLIESVRSESTRPSLFVLAVANLVPLAGVLVFRWDVFPTMMLFWLENVVIGAFNVLKMLVTRPAEPLSWAMKLFMVPFFAFHYGMFCFGHGVFLMVLFGGAHAGGLATPSVRSLSELMVGHGLGIAVVALVASHGFSFAWNFLKKGEYRRASLKQLMTQPYGRVVVLHIVLIASAFLVFALHSPQVGVVLLVVVKIIVDAVAHLRERVRLAAGANSPSPELLMRSALDRLTRR